MQQKHSYCDSSGDGAEVAIGADLVENRRGEKPRAVAAVAARPPMRHGQRIVGRRYHGSTQERGPDVLAEGTRETVLKRPRDRQRVVWR